MRIICGEKKRRDGELLNYGTDPFDLGKRLSGV
jgi:hypothetical protein